MDSVMMHLVAAISDWLNVYVCRNRNHANLKCKQTFVSEYVRCQNGLYTNS